MAPSRNEIAEPRAKVRTLVFVTGSWATVNLSYTSAHTPQAHHVSSLFNPLNLRGKADFQSNSPATVDATNPTQEYKKAETKSDNARPLKVA